jgi:hypothetical protein
MMIRGFNAVLKNNPQADNGVQPDVADLHDTNFDEDDRFPQEEEEAVCNDNSDRQVPGPLFNPLIPSRLGSLKPQHTCIDRHYRRYYLSTKITRNRQQKSVYIDMKKTVEFISLFLTDPIPELGDGVLPASEDAEEWRDQMSVAAETAWLRIVQCIHEYGTKVLWNKAVNQSMTIAPFLKVMRDCDPQCWPEKPEEVSPFQPPSSEVKMSTREGMVNKFKKRRRMREMRATKKVAKEVAKEGGKDIAMDDSDNSSVDDGLK